MAVTNHSLRQQDNARANKPVLRSAALCRYVNAAVMVLLGIYLFIIPFGLMVYYLADPALKGPGIPKFAVRLHQALSPKYEKWARQRVASGIAGELDLENISGTEWPIFGSAFYLWATESLQQARESDLSLCSKPPGEYAAGAIDAAAALVADPGHASWVIRHWGESYLERENVFYRMLLISGLTGHERLRGSGEYLDTIRDQAGKLADELDRSPYGILDDYPGQCYPTDVVAAIAAIKRANSTLGIDGSAFTERAIRGFQGSLSTPTGLIPYMADSRTGVIGESRGCSNQWVTVWAPELWPEQARQWYDCFERHFWQSGRLSVGFREFPKAVSDRDWYMDVDSGPVVGGLGAAASSFGLGAARANGRFDHAYPLSAELIVMSWPLPNGTLVIPRLLSDAGEAPYVGEAGVLFSMTRMPAEGAVITTGGRLPGVVYFMLAFYLAAGTLWVVSPLAVLRRWRRRISALPIPLGRVQLALWMMLTLGGVAVGIVKGLPYGLLLLLPAQFLPCGEKAIPAAVNDRSCVKDCTP